MMAINPLIAMQANTVDVGGALQNGLLSYRQGQQMQMERDRGDLQDSILRQQANMAAKKSNQETYNEAQKALIQGSFVAKQFLDAGDVEGARNYITSLKTNLDTHGIPSESIEQGLQLLQQDPSGQSLQKGIDANVKLGMQAGLLGDNQGVFAPQAAFDAQGNPVFIQGSKAGGISQLQGYRPYTPSLDEQTAAAIRKAQGLLPINVAEAAGKRAAEANIDLQTKPALAAAETTAKESAKASVDRSGKEVAAARDEQEVDRLLGKADTLLDTATGSYTGRGLDLLARAVGIATKGGISAGQLKAIEAALVVKMPRMEGPQSDRDAMLYRQAAGLIGDATVPAEERKAAIETIKFIHSRYTGASTNTKSEQQGQSLDDLVNKYAD